MASKNIRLLKMALSTVLGIKPQGFFIPYRYADVVPGPDQRHTYSELEGFFEQAIEYFEEVITSTNSIRKDLEKIGPDTPPEPRWTQSWFPPLDAAIAYAMVRHHAPKKIVEVGSGHSTRFMARAVKDGRLETQITAIDPAPRANIGGLDVNFVPTTVEYTKASLFQSLTPGDILFIDSSHIIMPGTDVDVLLNRILPALPAGVLIHIHDIFLPEDYPKNWQWRGYNEQLAVAGLIHSGGYQVLFSSQYVQNRCPYLLADTLMAEIPSIPGANDTSLWLEKK